MEQVHGVDVTWMAHRERCKSKPSQRRNTAPSQPRQTPRDPATLSPVASSPPPEPSNGHAATTQLSTTASSPSQIPAPSPSNGNSNTPSRPIPIRTGSSEKNGASSPGTPPQRRGSWLSSLSSKFSSSSPAQSPAQASTTTSKDAELSVPRAAPAKNAVLQHANKQQGDAPYTPAPPKSSQGSLLHVLRRLSSSSGGGGSSIKGHHGLVERRVLNVDRHRERCPLADLNQAKLRKVSFCVDVEIAPMPKYGGTIPLKKETSADATQKIKTAEKAEGQALKHPEEAAEQQEHEGGVRIPEKQGGATTDKSSEGGTNGTASTSPPDKAGDKKKEKKKRSEDERKARKERKRQVAEANGSIPMEIHLDSDSSAETTPPARKSTERSQGSSTTNPVRIYRRCCQLRETPVLKKITEQLSNGANFSRENGFVDRLDLTGYWMQLPDLVTLGDYLAVVPIQEVILENCGLTDEGLRVVLAGLLTARKVERRSRRPVSEQNGLTDQGGFVQRLVLKNNQIGPEGWKHICLFVYLCRTLKSLDVSSITFPHATAKPKALSKVQSHDSTASIPPMSICELFSRSLAERLAGSTLDHLDMGETGLDTDQLGMILDGVTKCGITRLGISNNNIDSKGLAHIARYVRSGICVGLNLGGNDLQESIDVVVDAIDEKGPLWALGLAECNLVPASLNRLLPKLAKLTNFVFIDLSHNEKLFRTSPSAVAVLRRWLPKMECLKRFHLTHASMTSEQIIALAEVLPEIKGLAHINFKGNSEQKSSDKLEEQQEEAFALFASLLAATRVSTSIVAVDIDEPTEQSGELVKAMARQIVAFCLRNMESMDLRNVAPGLIDPSGGANADSDPQYPVVLQHLVGHDVMHGNEEDADVDPARDEDYVIGGTGVVKALTACLKNRGDESRRNSGEFVLGLPGSGRGTPQTRVNPGKAKDMSKHLLNSARKIRHRLQPAIAKAKATPNSDANIFRRLMFLDATLDGIIKRFEDEFPDTREPPDSAISISPTSSSKPDDTPHPSALDLADPLAPGASAISDNEEDDPTAIIRPRPVSRSNSVVSLTSKHITDEEGRVFRAGHRFRRSWLEHYSLLSLEAAAIGADPSHSRILHEMLDDLGDEEMHALAREKGVVRVFQEHRDELFEKFRAADPENWDRFVESLEIVKANMQAEEGGLGAVKAAAGEKAGDEVAVAD